MNTTPSKDIDYVDFASIWQSLIKNKGLIMTISLLIFLFALIYHFYQPKKYQANLLLQIHQNRHHSINTLNQASQPSALDNLPEQSLAMQIALLRSKFILMPVIQSLGLVSLTHKPESLVVRQLQTHLSILDLSNSAENSASKAGIIQLAYIDEDPRLAAKILNEMAGVLQQKNRDYKIVEIEKKLSFLKQQLPSIKQSLQTTETQLNQYKSNTGRMNLSLQMRYFMSRLADIDKQLQELRFKRSNLGEQYTERYPLIQAISKKIQELETQRSHTYSELKKLPAEDQYADALIRDMQLKNKLYLAVLNQIHELEVAKAGVISDIHVLVAATPPDMALSLKPSLVGIASLLSGFILGCFLVIAWHLFSRRVRDPQWFEKVFEIQHLATIPFCRQPSGAATMLTGPGLEALCYLRTYLQLHQQGPSSIIHFIGLEKGVGKSFLISHLAILLAQLDQKVLLIDANLHDSRLHTYFSSTKGPGLSDILQGRSTLASALVQAEKKGLHFLPAGTAAKHPTDLLASGCLKELLQEASAHYSFILINSANAAFPSDCVLIGALAHLNWMIFSAELHQTNRAYTSMKSLKQLGLQLHGSIFNELKPEELGLTRLRRFYTWCRNAIDTKINPSIHGSRLNSHAERPYLEKS